MRSTTGDTRETSRLDESTPLPGLDHAVLDDALAEIRRGAAGRDESPAFPHLPFELLARAGALALPVPEPVSGPGRRATFRKEWSALRAVADADGSVGRIYDGHLNAVERLSIAAPEPLRSLELERVAGGGLLLGLWGADPVPGEGEPARLAGAGDKTTLHGVKTFCSGAGGVDRALVLARGPEGSPPGPPYLAYVDLSGAPERHEIDRGWYRSAGMRSSESHRVVFRDAPVLAVLGGPGEISRDPYFGRDAVRTAVSWAGIADRAVDSALATLAEKTGGDPDDIVSLAAGRMLAERGTMDRWIEHAATVADADAEASFAGLSIRLRSTIADSCRRMLDEAARACGSRPFAVSGPLDRARRDLELFLLQHRLEPALARAGREAILDSRGADER
ncbi:acyl-CoA dehydrogenase family protein [Rubrobacter aplysinae]|uniref:acyl-CoA dehydrogenase family protein n=1 Tax=Rubrobacter aplysinae TaxID=909625 RepID=UPI00064B8725|nr:acyl-CoA dehydrogenase family protein [Rubrobacter aplysinae]